MKAGDNMTTIPWPAHLKLPVRSELQPPVPARGMAWPQVRQDYFIHLACAVDESPNGIPVEFFKEGVILENSGDSPCYIDEEFTRKNADLIATAKRRLVELGEHALSPSETLLLFNAGILQKSAGR